MIRVAQSVGFLAFACALAAGVQAQAQAPVVLSDAGHHELRFEHPPRRIVSLVPSLTETVCALQECERLVAVDRYSNWPPRVSRLPKAGGFEDVQVEQIVALHPEVVLAANVPRVLERLRALGVTVFEFEAQSFDDIARNVSTLGSLLGVPLAAERLNRRIGESVSEVASAARRRLANRAPLVYYEVDPSPYGAGPKSFIGEMLARLGARNILTADLGPFPRLNPEYVVSGNPDVIVVAPDEVPRLSHRPGWDQIRAVREGRICSFSSQVDETIVRPGPRVGEGLEALAECLLRVAP